jgi:hypothetical protein
VILDLDEDGVLGGAVERNAVTPVGLLSSVFADVALVVLIAEDEDDVRVHLGEFISVVVEVGGDWVNCHRSVELVVAKIEHEI